MSLGFPPGAKYFTFACPLVGQPKRYVVSRPAPLPPPSEQLPWAPDIFLLFSMAPVRVNSVSQVADEPHPFPSWFPSFPFRPLLFVPIPGSRQRETPSCPFAVKEVIRRGAVFPVDAPQTLPPLMRCSFDSIPIIPLNPCLLSFMRQTVKTPRHVDVPPPSIFILSYPLGFFRDFTDVST